MTATASVCPVVARDAPAARSESHGITFHELLLSLNPLQHLPVVGTIYRAITGDEIPEAARNIGSIVVGGLMGGPMGLAGNMALLAFRKLTGVDIDQVGQNLLADIGIGHHTAKDSAGAAMLTVPIAAPAEPTLQDVGMRTTAWSAAQMRAYGVVTEPDGTPRQGDVSGSDVLNGLLLAELRLADGIRYKGAGIAMATA